MICEIVTSWRQSPNHARKIIQFRQNSRYCQGPIFGLPAAQLPAELSLSSMEETEALASRPLAALRNPGTR